MLPNPRRAAIVAPFSPRVVQAMSNANAKACRILCSTSLDSSPSLRSRRVTGREATPCTFATARGSQKTQWRKLDFVLASTVLRRQRHIDHQRTWRVRIVARDDDNRTSLCCQPKLSQPHFTSTSAHRAGPALLARPRATASDQEHHCPRRL